MLLDLPQLWISVPLKDCLKLNQSGVWGSEPTGDDTDVFVLRSTNIQDSRLTLDDVARRRVDQQEIARYTLEDGDILVTKSSGSPQLIGKNAIFRQPKDEKTYVFANFTQRLRTDRSLLLPDFLYFYLNSAFAHAYLKRLESTTSGLRNLNVRQYSLQPIPLPPLPEQQRIVEILRAADELRQLRARANRRAEELLPALFDAFYKDNHQEWDDGKIGDLIYFETGKSLEASAEPAVEGQWGILKVSAVSSGEFRPEENKALPETANFDPSLEVSDGELLVSRANTSELVGASALVYDPPPRLILPDKLWRAKRQPDIKCDFRFLHALFSSANVRFEISRRATGTSASMKNISQDKFLDIDINIPRYEVQEEFGKLSEEIRRELLSRNYLASARVQNLLESLVFRSFAGTMTAKWREDHWPELEQAARERDEILQHKRIVITDHITAKDEVRVVIVQPQRVIHNAFDRYIARTLSAAEQQTAYFRPDDLIDGNDLNLVQAEAGLRLLAALGFVREVEIDGQRAWRRINAKGETADKPQELAA